MGRCDPGLVAAVPAIADWKGHHLPRGLKPADVEPLLAACDRTSPTGRRDRAIPLLLARLGLRAEDVRSLHFDQIDWARGRITLAGKGRRESRLPLPQEVGDALLAWLEDGRPQVDDPHVFLRYAAPWRPFTESAAISKIVRRTIRRADRENVPSHGALSSATRPPARPWRTARASRPSGRCCGTARSRPRPICQGRSRRARRHRPALAGGGAMPSAAVERHVAMMRICGFVFDKQAGLLTDCAAYAEARGDTHVRTATVLDWSRRSRTHARWRIIYLTVRRFAPTALAEDARHEVPPPDLLPQTARQGPEPYIHAPEEIAALVSVADRAASWRCRVPGRYRVLFGLIATTGMRISEALGLDIADLTPDRLLIREAKRRGRRLPPLHPSVVVEFKMHLARRIRVRDASDAMVLGDRGGRLCYGTVRGAFRRMLAQAGLRGVAKGGRNPRIHDLRHTFAVRSREACTQGAATSPATWWPSAPWLVHVDIVDTYWYLEGTPTLLGQSADRTEAFAAGASS